MVRRLYGTRFDDLVEGTRRKDKIFGRKGDDTLSGGAGNDVVLGGPGDDRLIYDADANTRSYDFYSGGSGYDVLEIRLGDGWADNAAFQAELESFQSRPWFLSGLPFYFRSLGLRISGIEEIELVAPNVTPIVCSDSFDVPEDGILAVDALHGVLHNDTDPDGDPLTAVLVHDVQHGALTLNPDGSFTYTPDADFAGEDSFTYRASDGTATSDPVTVTITVGAVNDPPVAVADSAGVAEDGTLAVDAQDGVLHNDTDPDGDPLTAVLVHDVQHGALTLNPDGSFTYTPDADFAGEDSFTYRASDGTATSDPVTVTITVGAVNDPPVAVADSAGVAEDGTLAVDAQDGVLHNDTDPDGDPLTAVLESDVAHGALTLDPDGSFTYTPDADFAGEDSFTYRASDGTTTSDPVTVTITVGAVNDPPVAVADSAGVAEDGTLAVDAQDGVLHNDTDPDGDPLTAVLESNVAHGALTLNPDGSFTYTPDADFAGEESFTYRASDGTTTSDPVTVTITVGAVNDAPVAVADNASVAEDGTLTVDAQDGVLHNDTDPDGDPLTAVLVDDVQHGTLTLNPDGSFTYTPDADFAGEDSFTYRASDGTATSDPVRMSIAVTGVGDPPVAVGDAAATALGVPIAVDVLDNDLDPDEGDQLAIGSFGQGANGSVVEVGGVLVYTPDVGFEGVDSFTYAVSDSDGLSAMATVTVTVDQSLVVSSTGDGSDGDYSYGELTLREAIELANSGFGADRDGDGRVDIFFEEDTFVPGTATTIDVTATLEVTANVDIDGDVDGDGDSDVTIDGGGAVEVLSVDGADVILEALEITGGYSRGSGGGISASDATVRLVDSQVSGNIARFGAGIYSADSSVTVIGSTISGNSATQSGGGIHSQGSGGLLVIGSDVSDNESLSRGGGISSSAAELTVVNSTVAGNWSYSGGGVYYGGEGRVGLYGTTVYGSTAGDPDDLAGSRGNGAAGVHIEGRNASSLQIADSTITANVFQGFLGTDALLENGGGLKVFGTLSLMNSIVVGNSATNTSGADGDPDALGHIQLLGTNIVGDTLYEPGSGTYDFYDQTSAAYEDGALTGIALPDVFLVDASGDPVLADNGGPVPTVTLDPNPGNPAHDAADLGLAIDLDETATGFDYNGDGDTDDTFTTLAALLQTDADGNPRAEDSDGDGTDIADLGATETGVGDRLPVAADDTATTVEETPVTVDVLANDTDPDGDALTIVEALAGNGTAEIVDGTILYTPRDDFFGVDTIDYTIVDATGGYSRATVSVTVTNVDDGVIAADDAVETDEDVALTIDVAANDIDVDGDGLTVTLLDDVENGTLTQNDDGTFEYLPDLNYYGTDSFSYEISDGQGNSDTADVSITVNAVNDAPYIWERTFTMEEDTLSEHIDPWEGSYDVEGDTILTPWSNPSTFYFAGENGTFFAGGSSIVDGRKINFQSDSNFNGTAYGTIRFYDSGGAYTDATFTFIVTPVEDIPNARGDEFSGAEDGVVTGNVLTNDSDGDGDPLTVALETDVQHGAVVLDPDGGFEYTPDADFFGTDSFTYVVNDGKDNTDTATVTLTVEPQNDAPSMSVPSGLVTDENEPLEGVPITVVDVDDTTFLYAVKAGAEPSLGSVTFDEAAGTFTYTPDAGVFGEDAFTILVTDSGGLTDEQEITVSILEVLEVPKLSDVDPLAYVEDDGVDDGATDSHVVVIDSDVTLTNDGDFAGGSLAVSGLADGDEVGVRSAGTLTVTGNAIDDGGVIFAEITRVSGTELAISFNEEATDARVELLIENLTFATNDAPVEQRTLTLTLADGSGLTSNTEIDVTVTPVADTPMAVDDTVTTTTYGDVPIDVGANDIDGDGDALTLTEINGQAIAIGETIVLSSLAEVTLTDATTLTYDAPISYLAGDSFTYTISDGALSDTATVSIEQALPGTVTTVWTGSDNADNYTGGIEAELILALAGNDSILAHTGDDYIFGGAGDDDLGGSIGTDTAAYRGYVADYDLQTVTQSAGWYSTVWLKIADAADGGSDGLDEGVDTMLLSGSHTSRDIEMVAFADVAFDTSDGLFGDSGNNALTAGPVKSVVSGGEGADTLTASDGSTLLLGGSGDDEIAGGAGDDTAFGGDGDDEISGGAGDDEIDGNGGTDTAVYAGNSADYGFAMDGDALIVTDAAAGGTDGVDEGSDSLTGIEYLAFADLTVVVAELAADVTGTSGDDSLLNDSEGAEVIRALAGNNTMEGGHGDDESDGGPDNDTVVYAGSFTDYVIARDGDVVTVTDSHDGGADGTDEGTDTIVNVEFLSFADGTDYWI